ncbi:hypothetical protein LCL97_21665 [Seohaeicola saemankumensis]|nr:calcium-binding protein [Seohaeicola saemankumensis]MCA0873447.1 hypothetical protein [Seohaeicola saemankumensis]
MPTYTWTGATVSYDPVTENVVAVGTTPAVLELVVPETTTSLSYTLLATDPGDLPAIDINIDDYEVRLNGVTFGPGYDTTESYIGYVTWLQNGVQRTTIVLDLFFEGNPDVDYYFVIGGAALPQITTLAAWNAFEASVIDVGLATGAYGPNTIIPLSSLGATVSQDDELTGTLGNDVFNGGAGNDTINGLDGSDTIDGGAGDDTLTGLRGFDTINGGTGNDTITGGAGNDVINGGDDDDDINGGIGWDTLSGGEGNDTIRGLDGYDTINGNGGDDILFGNNGNDIMNGGGGNDTMNGGLGFDTMNGDDGNDIISGLSGFDTINGGTGNDTLNGNSGNDTLEGGAGDDTLNGGIGRDTLNGGGGDDVLNGNNGFDTLIGGTGNDTLNGHFGNDTLNGSAGNDTMTGGLGFDLFIFNGGTDEITDFTDDQDTVRLDDALWTGTLSVQDVIDTYASVVGTNTVFDFGGGNLLTLTGVTDLNSLTDDIAIF